MTDPMPWKKKLIEVALPLDAINAASAREKSIRHGHPSTLHLWWARRPLAACRAVLFSQLVDDPSAHPEQFPTEEEQDAERQRLFRIIEDLVKWENSTNETVLEAARVEIRRSCDGNPPPILDPFAGGGSIPLEAQRLGLEAHASDLNPVAVLINKALIEIPPRWAGHPPVHTEADNRTRWTGAEGLAEDVHRYGKWMCDEAEKRVGHLYPKATLPDGSQANVVAWIWTRTIPCPNPGCVATIPLASTYWLSKKQGREAWIRPVVRDRELRFEVHRTATGPTEPSKTGRGAKFICAVCGSSATDRYVRTEATAGRLGQQVMAVVAEGNRRRLYLPPDEEQAAGHEVARPDDIPDARMPDNPRWFSPPGYGLTRWSDLFTNRQLITLNCFSDLVGEVRVRVQNDAIKLGIGTSDSLAYARSVCTYLAFSISKTADRGSTLCTWYVDRESSKNTFSRQALAMSWDFAEMNPLLSGTGSLYNSTQWVCEIIKTLRPGITGVVEQRDARSVPSGMITATDPPYYDNIGYADLSDFFYLWLRRSLAPDYPDLFATRLTPKEAELIATPYRHGGSRRRSEEYFETGFVDVFRSLRSSGLEEFPTTLFYAFKQAENVGQSGQASTGWSTMLEGLSVAGWMVVATWPMRTEQSHGFRAIHQNSLASSIILACRPRPHSAFPTDRQGLIRALQRELPAPIRELQKALIAPVDLRQAAIGPGMAVFSRFARVIEPDGSTMRVRTALGLINDVLGTVLDEQEGEFDAESRWAIQWYSQFFADEGPYGVAEQLAVSMNVSVKGMDVSGILRQGGGKVRLKGRDELPDDWDPAKDKQKSVWEATQHLVKRLEEHNEAAAGRLLRQLGSLGESARLLAYRLYTVCETPRPALAGPYNALVASWPEIQRHAQEANEPMAVTEQQSFNA